MHSPELILLAVLGLLIWFWQDSARVKELASRAGLRTCSNLQLVFLDETVEFTRLALKRDRQGRMKIQRDFRFEFTSDGTQRYQGRIQMLGHQLKHLDMEPYRDHSET